MELMKRFAAEFTTRFGSVWPYELQIVEDYTWLLSKGHVPGVPPVRALRVANSFREILLSEGPEGVRYCAVPTEYGARSACSDDDRIIGEEGKIAPEHVFEFVILYLAGASPAKIPVQREPVPKMHPMRSVTVEDCLADQVWKSWIRHGVTFPAVIRVSPGWGQLPVRVPSQAPEVLAVAFRDPAISFTLECRSIGFQRVDGDVQYELREREEGKGEQSELGHLRNADEPAKLAVEWLGGADVADLSVARSVLRSTFVAGEGE